MCGVTVAIIYECVRQRRFSHFFAASGWCFLWVATFLASRFFFSHSGVWMHRNIAHHAPSSSSSSARWLFAVRLDEQTRTTTLLSTGPETPDVRNCSGLYRFKDFRTNLIDSAEKREETSFMCSSKNCFHLSITSLSSVGGAARDTQHLLVITLFAGHSNITWHRIVL